MAIKDQCAKCISFSEGACKLQSSAQSYDQISCPQYTKNGINLDKHEGQVVHKGTHENGDKTLSHQPDAPMEQKMLQHPFSFKGRIRRLEFYLSYILVYFLFIPFNLTPEYSMSDSLLIINLILPFPASWFLLAQNVKRCHDNGHPGWYQLIPLYWLLMCFADGDAYENDYGPDPKGRGIQN